MTSPKPTRQQADLADVLELVLDKGIVVNADIAVTVNETELLGVEIRAAIASFETAAEYGLAFPSGTDMERVEAASGRQSLDDDEDTVDLGIDASDDSSEQILRSEEPPQSRPDPETPGEEDDGEDATGNEPTTEDSETDSADESADESAGESNDEATPEATGDTTEDDG